MFENLFNQSVINHFIFALIRMSSMFLAAPILGSKLVPVRLRLFLAILVTFIIFPLLPEIPNWQPVSIQGFLVTIEQVLIGIIIGLVFQFVFQVIVLGGQILAMQAGLGFATLVDPQNHENLPMISQFYMLAVTLLFLVLDGHLKLIQMVVHSFNLIPIGNFGLSTDHYMDLVLFAGTIFSGAIAIALPAIISLLMVNITFAVITRTAPQINIFSIGFPLTLVFGLFVMYLSFPSMIGYCESLFDDGFSELTMILGRT